MLLFVASKRIPQSPTESKPSGAQSFTSALQTEKKDSPEKEAPRMQVCFVLCVCLLCGLCDTDFWQAMASFARRPSNSTIVMNQPADPDLIIDSTSSYGSLSF